MQPVRNSLLWEDHPDTPRQRTLSLAASRKPGKLTQADLLIDMLRSARMAGRALELPEIMRAGIAQHGARLAALRQRGFVIHNEMERSSDGLVLSRYWLTLDPAQEGQQP